MWWRASNRALILRSVVFLLTLLASAVGCRDSRRSGGSVSGGGPTGGSGTAVVEWSAPEENSDGTALVDLEGYNLYYGNSPGDYSWVLELGGESEVELTELEAGTYYFAVTAVATDGRESDFSSEVSKTIY